MKQILVLGAGFVARPLVRYLLEQPDFHVTVADHALEKAEKLVNTHPRATALALQVEDSPALQKAVKGADLVVSLLPWTHHLAVARHCLDAGRHLVTTSYVQPEMAAMDAAVRDRGLIFLNEIGVDPGIDHMAAMQVIDRVRNAGGEITAFYSYCGGLPEPAHNTNPFGYKFSWSPTGVLLAAKNDGRYLRDGQIIDIPGDDLFTHYRLVDVPGAGTFETYVNRDALPYRHIYGIPSVRSLYRGTLRNISHCESWHHFKRLGLLREDIVFDFAQLTPRQVLTRLVGNDGSDLTAVIARFLTIPEYALTIKKLQWLGLLSDTPVPLQKASPFRLFAHLLEKRLVYGPDETDMLVQHHEFTVRYPDNTGRPRRETITSTLVETGIPGGDSAMSRTVALPAAIAVRRILDEDIRQSGVRRPVTPDIYEPVLAELNTLGISLTEQTWSIPE